jgi:diacylglycerol kinase family enzyme
VSFGVYAQAVHREEYRGEKRATVRDTVTKAAQDRDSQAQMRYVTPDGRTHERAPLLLVSNNIYHYSGYPDYGRRLRLDSGKLGIGAITNLPEGEVAALRLDQVRSLQEWETPSYRIESDEPILAGLDGEAVEFESPLHLVTRPGGLRALVPAGTRPGFVPRGEVVAARLLDLAQTAGLAD